MEEGGGGGGGKGYGKEKERERKIPCSMRPVSWRTVLSIYLYTYIHGICFLITQPRNPESKRKRNAKVHTPAIKRLSPRIIEA